MLSIRSAVSGEELTQITAEDFQGKSEKELKTFIGEKLGYSRFRQRLFCEDGKEIKGDKLSLDPQNVQLVVLDLLPNDRTEDEKLLAACRKDNEKTVEKLLQRPRNPSVWEISGSSAIHLAAEEGHQNCVSLLLEARADKEARHRQSGMTPLHLACRMGHTVVVCLLIDRQADPNTPAKDGIGATGMHYCASEGHLETLVILNHLGGRVDDCVSSYATPLHFASLSGHADIAKSLLELRANPESLTIDIGATPLQLASRKGNVGVVKELLAVKADKETQLTIDGSRPMHTAAQMGHTEVVKILLQERAQPAPVTSDRGLLPLHYAAQNGHAEMAEALLDAKFPCDAATSDLGATPLHLACHEGHTEIARRLIHARANVNKIRDDNGQTPLHFAASRGHDKILLYLLNAGADRNIRSTGRNHLTPYQCAVCMQKTECKTILENYQSWKSDRGWIWSLKASSTSLRMPEDGMRPMHTYEF